MRVSFNMIYGKAVTNMNTRLAEIIRLNEQTSSQQKLTRPSDNPSGMARALDLRSTLNQLTQYEENLDTAEGWLTLADDALRLASDVTTRLKELCEQAATGTYTAEQRSMIAAEARQLMEELVGIANTEYAGDSIFAGSKTTGNAYEMGLAATVQDPEGASLVVEAVAGGADSTIYLEFLDSGEVGTDELRCRYTTDGGSTWQEATLAAGETVLQCGGVQATLAAGSTVTATEEAGSADGTALWLRPAAIYQGNTTDAISVLHAGSSATTATAAGVFSTNVVVRLDADATLPGPLGYAYSTDNGATWSTGHTSTNGTLQLPGGILTLGPDGTALTQGEQFLVQPENGAITLAIGASTSVQINNIGKDIFGGLYTPAGAATAQAAEPQDANLLEAVGQLVGYLESNTLDGIGQCLEAITKAQAQLTTALGVVGGRETRLEFARSSVATISDAVTAALSNIEDADTVQLAVDLAKAEYAYQAVLQSSSSIMKLSLLNYL